MADESYGYDTQNRLIEVRDGNGNLIARYGYDPFNRRIWKEQYRDRSGNVLAQAKRSYYLYADEGLIAESRQDITLDANESVSASAEPAIASQYGPRPDAEFTTGVLFVKTKNSNGDDTVAYYHHDHLEMPIQATDKQGNVVWSAQYNVFGRATITTPAATPDRPTISSALRLPGQIEDEETGLHYNWHRYYEPGLGRYVTADPIGLLGGMNRYAYVRGNPVNWGDATGEFCVPCIGIAIITAGIAIWNYYDTANDIADTANVFADPCSSRSDKLSSIGWLVVGTIDLTPGNVVKKAIKSGKKVVTKLNPNDLIPTQPLTKNRKQMKRLSNEIDEVGEITESLKYVERDGKKYLVDGHHRRALARQKGINEVPAEQVELPYKSYKTEKDLEYSQY